MALNNMEEMAIKQEIEELVREEELMANSGSSEENICTAYSLSEKAEMLMTSSKVFFTHFEKELILALAKPHLKIINSHATTAAISAEKAKVFHEIASQFNNTHGVNPRTVKQVRQCYQNLKKKLRKKSTSHRPEEKEAGGVEVSKQPNLPSVKYQILARPVVIVPFSTSCDSDTSSMEISKSQDKGTLTSQDKGTLTSQDKGTLTSQDKGTLTSDLVCPLTPSDSTSEMDSSNLNDSDKKETPPECQNLESDTPEVTPVVAEASGAKITKENTLRQMLTRFRKKTKPPTAPCAAARAAACIEAEHIQSTLFMKNEEERKEQRAEAERKEQELRMEHLREKIKLTKTKTLIHEKILELMDKNPECIKLLKNVLSEE